MNQQAYKDQMLRALSCHVVELRRFLDDDSDAVEICEAIEPILERLGYIEILDDDESDNVLDFMQYRDKKIMFDAD